MRACSDDSVFALLPVALLPDATRWARCYSCGSTPVCVSESSTRSSFNSSLLRQVVSPIRPLGVRSAYYSLPSPLPEWGARLQAERIPASGIYLVGASDERGSSVDYSVFKAFHSTLPTVVLVE